MLRRANAVKKDEEGKKIQLVGAALMQNKRQSAIMKISPARMY